jgi:hypothetical protein
MPLLPGGGVVPRKHWPHYYLASLPPLHDVSSQITLGELQATKCELNVWVKKKTATKHAIQNNNKKK